MKHHAVFKEQRDFSYIGPNGHRILRIYTDPKLLAESEDGGVEVVIGKAEQLQVLVEETWRPTVRTQKYRVTDPIMFFLVDKDDVIIMPAARVSAIAYMYKLKLVPWRKGQLARTDHDIRFGPGHFPAGHEFVDMDGVVRTSLGRVVRRDSRERLYTVVGIRRVGQNGLPTRIREDINIARIVSIVRTGWVAKRRLKFENQAIEKTLDYDARASDPRRPEYKAGISDVLEALGGGRKGYWYANHPNAIIYRIFCEISQAHGSTGSYCQPRVMAMLHNNGRQLMRKVSVVTAAGFRHELYEINKKRMMRWVQTNFNRMQRPYKERTAVTQRNQRRYHTEFDVFGGALPVHYGQRN
jgi:hypothetical protein